MEPPTAGKTLFKAFELVVGVNKDYKRMSGISDRVKIAQDLVMEEANSGFTIFVMGD